MFGREPHEDSVNQADNLLASDDFSIDVLFVHLEQLVCDLLTV